MADLKATVTITARDLPQVREEMERAQAEIARLRALIKQAEWANEAREGAFCPWCGSEAGGAHLGANGEDCPAFTPDGAVR